MVVVTHDLPSAYGIADRIVVLLDGQVAALGMRDEVWNSPDTRIRDFIERRMAEGGGRGMDVATLMEI
jgi:phospholipid/cholesterol/gamma-HCH transport system ATP-binding protein